MNALEPGIMVVLQRCSWSLQNEVAIGIWYMRGVHGLLGGQNEWEGF